MGSEESGSQAVTKNTLIFDLFLYALDVDWVLFVQLCIRFLWCFFIFFSAIEIKETENSRQSRVGMLYPNFLELRDFKESIVRNFR